MGVVLIYTLKGTWPPQRKSTIWWAWWCKVLCVFVWVYMRTRLWYEYITHESGPKYKIWNRSPLWGSKYKIWNRSPLWGSKYKIWNRSPLVTRITKKQCCTIRGYRTIIHGRPRGFAGKSHIYCFIFSVLCDCISSKKLNARNLPEGRFHISLLRGIWDAGHHHVSATAEIRDVPTWKLTHDHFRHSLGPMIRRTWPPTHLCVGAQFFTTE